MEGVVLYVFMPFLYMIFGVGLFLIILKFVLKYFKNRNSQIKNIDKSIYYRDIPCFENVDIAYWLLYNFSNKKKDDLNTGLIGAYLLKWYKKGYIDIKHSQNIGLKRDSYNIDLKDGKWTQNYVEREIYEFLKNVAGNNNILEKNEIRNYCSIDGNKSDLEWLFEHILSKIQETLEEKKYITIIPSKNYILFKTRPKITLSEELINEYQNLNGLKNFLLDYSNMKEKMHIEVHIWEDYIIFANLLGITDKVKQQFNKIYPDFNNINIMFDMSFDNTLIGQLNILYKNLLKLLIFIFGSVATLLMWISGEFKQRILRIVPIIIAIAPLYWLFRKNLINKKVKEMNKTTYAKITKVDWNKDKDRTTYSFTYEYTIDNIYYTGSGISNSRRKNGQSIKIYYNEMKPEKSETAQKHNYYMHMIVFYIIMLCLIYSVYLLHKSVMQYI